jgi:hypothetical protein
MKTFRQTIFVLGMMAVFAAPLFAFAQTAPPATGASITQQELVAYESQLAQLRLNLQEDPTLRTNPTFQQELDIQKATCEQLDAKLMEISSNERGAVWIENEIKCAFSSLEAIPFRDGFRYERRPNQTAEAYMQGVKDGQVPTLTKAIYDANAKQQRDQSLSGFDAIDQAINWIVEGLGNVVAAFLAGLATLALKLLDYIVSYLSLASRPEVVVRGWIIVRDLMNLLFILALIVMALGTILQRDALSYKRLLPRLIIAALLINFSLVIAETLIGFSDMLISFFKPSGGIKVFAETIYGGFQLDSIGNFFGQGRGTAQGLASIVTKLVALTILTVSLLAISMLMFVRLVGLWFFTMISPAAFALDILPFTQDTAKQIRSRFFKYLIWGPVAMFFFRVAFIFIQDVDQRYVAEPALNYLFISAFLWAGFLAAKGSGMAGASAITGLADKALGKAKGYGIGGAKSIGSLTWRGTIPGGIAAGGAYLASGFDKNMAGQVYRGTKEFIGTKTARIQNLPGVAKEVLFDIPDKERKKLVDKEKRRTMIKKNFLKDFDEETAKKISPEDVATMFESGNYNETKFRNILEHGRTDAKLALAAAYKEGLIKANSKTKFEDAQAKQIAGEIKEFAWRHRGGKKDNMPSDFMEGTNLDDDIQYAPKNTAKFAAATTFRERVTNGYVKVDPKKKRKSSGKEKVEKPIIVTSAPIDDTKTTPGEPTLTSEERALRKRRIADGLDPDTGKPKGTT